MGRHLDDRAAAREVGEIEDVRQRRDDERGEAAGRQVLANPLVAPLKGARRCVRHEWRRATARAPRRSARLARAWGSRRIVLPERHRPASRPVRATRQARLGPPELPWATQARSRSSQPERQLEGRQAAEPKLAPAQPAMIRARAEAPLAAPKAAEARASAAPAASARTRGRRSAPPASAARFRATAR